MVTLLDIVHVRGVKQNLDELDWFIIGYHTKKGNGYKHYKKREWYD